MHGSEIKEKLLEWLNKPFNEPDSEWIEALADLETSDEILLGAQHFLFDTKNDYQLLHKTIGALNLPLKTNGKAIRTYAIAATLILLIGISVFFKFSNNSNKFEIIEEGLPVFMANTPNNSNLFMNAYRTGDYAKAIEIGAQLTRTDTLNFYMGCSYLYSRDNKSAIAYFYKIDAASEFYCNVLYQSAFANANLENNEEAIKLLKVLVKRDCSNYLEKAEDFLKALETRTM